MKRVRVLAWPSSGVPQLFAWRERGGVGGVVSVPVVSAADCAVCCDGPALLEAGVRWGRASRSPAPPGWRASSGFEMAAVMVAAEAVIERHASGAHVH